MRMRSSEERAERWSLGCVVRTFFNIGFMMPELALERRRLAPMMDGFRIQLRRSRLISFQLSLSPVARDASMEPRLVAMPSLS